MKLAKTYQPRDFEPEIYALWEESDSFKPRGDGEPFSIIMPPPNANGNLHLGHALGNAVQDSLVRYYRMRGRRTIYIPGADHAGFETWVVYERQLEAEGKTRFDYSRDELYQQTWDFVARSRGGMEVQLRELGASCDWDSLVFTLDSEVVARSYETFRSLWDDGLIYRGERLVSFCTKHQTSFADIEVVYKEKKGKIWEIKYDYAESNGSLTVATTRPETMFGDVAVAVHPDDKRYRDLVGKHVKIPLIDKAIPVITDEMVDKDFGTGAVKITPAHDQNDFEVGERHDLPRVTVIDNDGQMNENAPERYRGLAVNKAREAVVRDLDESGYLVSEESYKNSVGECYKCGTVIQPLLRDQWFIRVRPLADRAIAAIEEGQIKFTPESRGRVLIDYLKKLRDWNISRQIPWGIPIPAFQSEDDPSDWIFNDEVDQEEIEVDGKRYKRDPDTFDTWFSSGQWPFITTKYHRNPDLSEFFPSDVMETGHDILYQWVSRMIMLSLYVEDQVPFKEVYLHGLVLDSHGQKMSKSKGNVVNPLETIAEFGSDALRIGLLSSRSPGQNQAFGLDKVTAGRNFCNKLWNVARFIEGQIGQDDVLDQPDPKSSADHWILQELDVAANTVALNMEERRFAEATEIVYHTIWDKVADWYLEASKSQPNPSVMVTALRYCLKIAHPFAPFVTETIWQTLDWEEDMLITSSWPERVDYDSDRANEFEQIIAIVTEIRAILSDIGSRDVGLTYIEDPLVSANHELIQRLSGVGYVQATKEGSGLRLTSSHQQIWLDLDQDQISDYRDNLEQKLQSVKKDISALEHRLANQNYVKSAPSDLVEESRLQLSKKTTEAQHLEHQLKHLQKD